MRPLNYAFLFAIVITIICVYSVVNKAHGHTMESACVIQKIYTPDGETLVETKMVCRDGNVGPSYWELFAQFYYRDINTPEYCRYYSRPKHAFRSFGKVCMNKDGEWEVE